MKRLWKKNKGIMSFAFLAVMVSEGLLLGIDMLKGKVADSAVRGDLRLLLIYFAIIGISSVLMPFCFYGFTLFIQIFRVRCETELRKNLFFSILGRSYPQYLENPEGSYLSCYTSQIGELEFAYFNSVFGFSQIVANYLIALTMLLYLNPYFLILSVIGVIPALVIPGLLQKVTTKAERNKIYEKDRNIAMLNEYISGIEVILSYGKRKAFSNVFSESTHKLMKASAKPNMLMVTAKNLTQLLLEIYAIAIIAVAAFDVAKGKLSVGSYIASIGILSQIVGNTAFTSFYLQQFSAVKETIKHIIEISQYEKTDDSKEITLDEVEQIEYSDVSFSHDESRDIINGFSMNAKQKGIYLIKGESGSGKSTLMNLMFNYYRPKRGRVLLNGNDASKISNIDDLITIMRQEAIFFDGSLRENLTMFREISDEEVINLMKKTGLDKYADSDVLSKPVGSYSGGEKRRMMVVRALLRKSPILILDEPFANLDSESINAIEKVLAEEKGRFIFVISHQELGKSTLVREISL